MATSVTLRKQNKVSYKLEGKLSAKNVDALRSTLNTYRSVPRNRIPSDVLEVLEAFDKALS